MQSSRGDQPFREFHRLVFLGYGEDSGGYEARNKISSRETVTESAREGFLLQSASPGYDRGWDTEAFRLRGLTPPQTVR